MILVKLTGSVRSDFWGDWQCEFCHSEFENKRGYNDINYRQNVIPKLPCPVCFRNSNFDTEYAGWYDSDMNTYKDRPADLPDYNDLTTKPEAVA